MMVGEEGRHRGPGSPSTLMTPNSPEAPQSAISAPAERSRRFGPPIRKRPTSPPGREEQGRAQGSRVRFRPDILRTGGRKGGHLDSDDTSRVGHACDIGPSTAL